MSDAQISRRGAERCQQQLHKKEPAESSVRRPDDRRQPGKMPEPAEGVRTSEGGEERRSGGGGGGEEPKDQESNEQKLYKVASELLQTERAYVARLRLLDQVSVHPSSGFFIHSGFSRRDVDL